MFQTWKKKLTSKNQYQNQKQKYFFNRLMKLWNKLLLKNFVHFSLAWFFYRLWKKKFVRILRTEMIKKRKMAKINTIPVKCAKHIKYTPYISEQRSLFFFNFNTSFFLSPFSTMLKWCLFHGLEPHRPHFKNAANSFCIFYQVLRTRAFARKKRERREIERNYI